MAVSLKDRLLKTREGLFERIKRLIKGAPASSEILGELEEILLSSDISLGSCGKIIEAARQKTKESGREALLASIKDVLLEIVSQRPAGPLECSQDKPLSVMVVGVNGAGKTTTIGKMARSFVDRGKKGVFAACDTFRAAAVEQLEVLAGKTGTRVVRQKTGADPAAVAFDALKSAKAAADDFLILDTAGRLHTKRNLMEELKKIKRVLAKEDPSHPKEIFLVLDASFGQNVISQVKEFHEALSLTGLVMAKMDGTAKGGTLVTLLDSFPIPVRYIGVGEKEDDLLEFVPRDFVEAIFS